MRKPLFAAALLGALSFAPGAQAADTAQPWFDNCAVFMKVLSGGQGGDTEIGSCIAQTEGLVNGMQVGSQVGALAFAGLVTIQSKIDEEVLWQLFQRTNPSMLLGICMPQNIQTGAQIEAVYRHIEKNPAKKVQPVGQVFYDALSEKWPCQRGKDGAAVKPVSPGSGR